MAQYGFIHDKLDVKLLVLYILSHAVGPVDRDNLLEVAMVDDGVDYFTFMEVLSELEESEHITCEVERYAITDKGRKNSAVCESSLPYSVKRKCLRKLSGVNAALRRSAQVRSQVTPLGDGTCTLRLSLDDEDANLLTIELLAPSQAQAERLSDGFQARPEQVYNSLLDVLLELSGKEGNTE